MTTGMAQQSRAFLRQPRMIATCTASHLTPQYWRCAPISRAVAPRPIPGENEANCSFFDSAIAAGINRAVDTWRSRHQHLAWGAQAGPATTLRNAINRATLAGIVIVVSAGNEANDADPAFDPNNPSPFAQALVANGNGLVIIATSVDDQGVISNFSNKAGDSQTTVLSALGRSICCEYQNDTIYRVSSKMVRHLFAYLTAHLFQRRKLLAQRRCWRRHFPI